VIDALAWLGERAGELERQREAAQAQPDRQSGAGDQAQQQRGAANELED
jgi:hypothetical protein